MFLIVSLMRPLREQTLDAIPDSDWLIKTQTAIRTVKTQYLYVSPITLQHIIDLQPISFGCCYDLIVFPFIKNNPLDK